MLAQLILSTLMSQGSKKAAYFYYSADLGGTLLLGILFLTTGDGSGFAAFLVIAGYVLYFFNVGRKSVGENAETFAVNLLKWSAISVPFELAMLGLVVWIAISSM